MFQNQIQQLSYEALYLILVISAPPILISMLFGLLVAVFQAATQIQEQTVSFTFKLAAAIITIMLMGGWIGAQIYQFGINIFMNFPKWGN